MSRIGKKPIEIPEGVEVSVASGNVSVKGPKGSLNLVLHPNVKLSLNDKNLDVQVDNPEAGNNSALWGLHRALIANMVKGVKDGFEKKLEISGVGFRAAVAGNKIVLNLVFSHPVELQIPEGVIAVVEKNIISVSGIDRQAVGQFAAVIRSQKPPEPYKGKGIKYEDEVVRRKAGKAAKAVGGA